MKDLGSLSDPYANIRTALAGSGYRFVFVGNSNETDALRGEFFLHMREHFPASYFVDEEPPTRGAHGCYCRIVRNPTPKYGSWLTKSYPRQCGCRLIVDASAPYWGGRDITWGTPDRMAPPDADTVIRAVQAVADVADVVTVPWAEYAQDLREHEGINAVHVPDSDEDDETAHVQHTLAWTRAVTIARNRHQ